MGQSLLQNGLFQRGKVRVRHFLYLKAPLRCFSFVDDKNEKQAIWIASALPQLLK